jgi:hypothetical protein
MVPPEAIKDNGSFTSAALDTKGADYAEILAILGATDIEMSTLKVQECATSGGSYSDVTGLVFGTSTNTGGSTSEVPAATDDDTIYKFEIDVRYTERYLKIVATYGDGTVGGFFTAVAILSRLGESPKTAALAGCDQILRV